MSVTKPVAKPGNKPGNSPENNQKQKQKRAKLPRAADYAKTFLKDWERLTHAGRYDMQQLKAVMLLLIAKDSPLGAEWLDHPLKGNWDGHRECHVGGDFLLAYKVDDSGKTGIIVFVRAGTHAELFG